MSVQSTPAWKDTLVKEYAIDDDVPYGPNNFFSPQHGIQIGKVSIHVQGGFRAK